MANLNKKVAEMEFDGLVSDLNPSVKVDGGTIRKGSAEATFVRGTIFAKSSTDGKLVILGTTKASGETLTANCILCDDVTVGTDADVTVPVYVIGCFDPDKCTVKESYTVTEADKDALRNAGIFFKTAQA